MSQPTIEKHATGEYRLSGELTMQSVSALAQQAAQALADASGEVSIDLSGVSRADSAGLALLIDLLRLARRQQFSVQFQGLPDQLLQIARLCELDELLPISA